MTAVSHTKVNPDAAPWSIPRRRVLYLELGKGRSVAFACKRAGFSTATLYKKTQEYLAEEPPFIEEAYYWQLWRAVGQLAPNISEEAKQHLVNMTLRDLIARLTPPEPPSNVIDLDSKRPK